MTVVFNQEDSLSLYYLNGVLCNVTDSKGPVELLKLTSPNENVLSKVFSTPALLTFGTRSYSLRVLSCCIMGCLSTPCGCWWHAISYKDQRDLQALQTVPSERKMLPAETALEFRNPLLCIPCACYSTSESEYLALVSILKKILTDSFFKKMSIYLAVLGFRCNMWDL